MWRRITLLAPWGAVCCGCAAGPTSWCLDGPTDFVVAAGMERTSDGTLLLASSWGKTDEGGCAYTRIVGGLHAIAPDGEISVGDLPGEPGIGLAAGNAEGLLAGGGWLAGGIGGRVEYTPGPDPPLYSVAIDELDASKAAEPASDFAREFFSAGGAVFLRTGGSLYRYEDGDFMPVTLGGDVLAATAAGAKLFAVLGSGTVVAIDPDALAVTASYDGCASASITPFGAAKLVLACEQGIGVVDTLGPAFELLSPGERFEAVRGGTQVEVALVATTGGFTRIFTLASGAQGELAGTVFDAELTAGAAYAVLVDGQSAPFVLDGVLTRIPYDGTPASVLLDSWGPMHVAWDEAGEVTVSSGRNVHRFDSATGSEIGEPRRLEAPRAFTLPLPW